MSSMANDGAAAPRWSLMEKLALVRVIKKHLPIGPAEWQKVVEEHALVWDHCTRNENSIKRCFVKLYKTKKPTGDASCPPEIKEAKQAIYAIREKVDLGCGAGGSDDGSA